MFLCTVQAGLSSEEAITFYLKVKQNLNFVTLGLVGSCDSLTVIVRCWSACLHLNTG